MALRVGSIAIISADGRLPMTANDIKQLQNPLRLIAPPTQPVKDNSGRDRTDVNNNNNNAHIVKGNSIKLQNKQLQQINNNSSREVRKNWASGLEE